MDLDEDLVSILVLTLEDTEAPLEDKKNLLKQVTDLLKGEYIEKGIIPNEPLPNQNRIIEADLIPSLFKYLEDDELSKEIYDCLYECTKVIYFLESNLFKEDILDILIKRKDKIKLFSHLVYDSDTREYVIQKFNLKEFFEEIDEYKLKSLSFLLEEPEVYSIFNSINNPITSIIIKNLKKYPFIILKMIHSLLIFPKFCYEFYINSLFYEIPIHPEITSLIYFQFTKDSNILNTINNKCIDFLLEKSISFIKEKEENGYLMASNLFGIKNFFLKFERHLDLLKDHFVSLKSYILHHYHHYLKKKMEENFIDFEEKEKEILKKLKYPKYNEHLNEFVKADEFDQIDLEIIYFLLLSNSSISDTSDFIKKMLIFDSNHESLLFTSLKCLNQLENLNFIRDLDGIRYFLDLLKEDFENENIYEYIARIFLKLCKNENIKQILMKTELSLLLSDFIKKLTIKKDKIIQLLEELTTFHLKDSKEDLFNKLEKEKIIENTLIPLNDSNFKEMNGMILDYIQKYYPNISNQFKKELNGNFLSSKLSLEDLTISYFKNQHKQCENPIQILPPLSFNTKHSCPLPSRKTQSLFPSKKTLLPYIYSNYCLMDTFQDQYTCCSFINHQLFLGDENGTLTIYDNGLQVQTHILDSFLDCIQYKSNYYLAWVNDGEVNSSIIYKKDFSKYDQLDEIDCSRFNPSGNHIACTTQTELFVYDVQSKKKIFSIEEKWREEISPDPYYHLCEDILLTDNILWDLRMKKKIHKFDQISDRGYTVCHPNGLELIIDSEIWDIRTLKLLKTCHDLSSTKYLVFNKDMLFVTYDHDHSAHQFNVIDPKTYQTIYVKDVKNTIIDFAVDENDMNLCIISNDFISRNTLCNIYEIGRKEEIIEEDQDEEDLDHSQSEEEIEDEIDDLFSEINDEMTESENEEDIDEGDIEENLQF